MLAACGSRAWAAAMAAARPLPGSDALFAAAETSWARLTADDWEEAFAAHLRIGDRRARGVAGREQAGVRGASPETLEALAAANAQYEARFGRVYLVCATGLSAGEMLALCRQRLQNDAEAEFAMAVEEQKKITRLRLERWLA
jgi:OHCU decarboxylase